MLVGGFVIVALAAGSIGAILTYVARELHYEHLAHPKGK
jgi:hypothetical protein